MRMFGGGQKKVEGFPTVAVPNYIIDSEARLVTNEGGGREELEDLSTVTVCNSLVDSDAELSSPTLTTRNSPIYSGIKLVTDMCSRPGIHTDQKGNIESINHESLSPHGSSECYDYSEASMEINEEIEINHDDTPAYDTVEQLESRSSAWSNRETGAELGRI
ncbi:hypothetical protein CC78DRAFT_542655 [Lojkania enalia]|uniref:Uncharacterized protein n=1 Tax=Lojkania enalia TaxID=147567 RepID=A0A9P4KE16_9PLEO|nr:hypothetical protein CC78DRAFT_542655 [Didymosphaeria enalia]